MAYFLLPLDPLLTGRKTDFISFALSAIEHYKTSKLFLCPKKNPTHLPSFRKPNLEKNVDDPDDKAKPVKFSIEGSDEHLDSPQIVIDPPSKSVSIVEK